MDKYIKIMQSSSDIYLKAACLLAFSCVDTTHKMYLLYKKMY